MKNQYSNTPIPKKSLGQVLLNDPDVAYQIVELSGLKSGDQVLEIGPGGGMLTHFLLKRQVVYTGCEIDSRMAKLLAGKFSYLHNFRLLEQDIMALDPDAVFPTGDFRIIGNIPYHLTSPILFKFFDYVKSQWDGGSPLRLKTMTIMLQKEVADRLLSSPKTKLWGILSIQTSLFADIQFLLEVPAEKFHPSPKIDSSVIKLTFRPACPYQIDNYGFFTEILRAVFARRRKMLRNTLKPFNPPDDLPLDLQKRPEELTAAEFALLANKCSSVQVFK